MDSLEIVRQVVDETLRKQKNKKVRRCGFVHLYGVSMTSNLIAIKRGLDPKLASTAAMLHDIWNYKVESTDDHAMLSSVEAKNILKQLEIFTKEEIDIICGAIFNHSDKGNIHKEYDELLKDADVLQHYLYNVSFDIKEHEKDRLRKVLLELDIELENL
ncbi:HD domain-containing protein [Dethiothermospora halolimnae]|uniref:HD domain-containing protein n=1 Tax=Dethiothermospora halolimnae TaxID=3114390 RepID=UPI003CCB9EEE